jgi:hypothetical protein
LHISESLVSGRSSACDTFANLPLHAATGDSGFSIASLLVFGFFAHADDPLPCDDDVENNDERLEYYRNNL